VDRMSIGDFARATGLTAKALRLYDEMGLVRPAQVDEYSGYRYYRDDQLDRARLVARLRLIGMPLDRIRVVADLSAGARAAELISYWRQVEADTSSRRAVVDVLVTELRTEEHAMSVDDTPRPTVASRTGVGSRDRQLDALLTGSRVYAVADGFGSDDSTATRALDRLATLDDTTGTVDPVRVVDDAVGAAAAAVAEQRPAGTDGDGPGCTLTALLLGNSEAVIAHIGDSRAYLVRDGRLQRLTRDHTDVQSLVDEGRLTEDEARSHERRAELNRALVAGKVAVPDISLHVVRPGDRFVLTTDGVHAVLPPGELSSLLRECATPEDAVTRVEDAVLQAGAPDNYAIVAVDLPG
jgi:PPM family protein phosphatase